MHLAVTLGRVNVDRMLRSLTAKQFREWLAYAELEPQNVFPELRADYRAASIRQEVFNLSQQLSDVVLASQGVERGKRPRFKKTKLEDFVIKWEAPKPKRQQTWQEQWEIVKMIAHAYSVKGVNV